ncbi:MAG: RDD family protein [Gemmatimonadota bacterium]|jgi:hypothetical protein
MDRRYDPRTIVTPYAFAVHPDLLGRPLATPGQRLGAILVDLIVIAFISQVGAAPLAIGSVALLFWLAFRKPGRDVLGKVFRIAVGCLGVFILFLTALVILWIRYGDDFMRLVDESRGGVQIEEVGDPNAGEGQEESEGLGAFLSIVQGVGGAVELQNAGTEEEAQTLLNEFVESAYDSGLSRSEIRELALQILPQDADWSPRAAAMVDVAIQNLAGPGGEPGDESQGAETVETGREPEQALPEAGPQESLGEVATDSIQRLNRALRLAEDDREDAESALARTREELEEERNRGPLSWLWDLIDELGIGFGWGALYLTITHAWWRGTSIGKKLFRIRVVMIDKRPLNWWLSFERAGGYAAGFATGLLGFAQIFWDPNRQAIHDKVSETIVIQDAKDPVPGPWMEEGKAMWKGGGHGQKETLNRP